MEHEKVLLFILILIFLSTGIAGIYIYNKLVEISDRLRAIMNINIETFEKLTKINLKM